MSGANLKELLKLVGGGVVLEVIGGASFSGVLYSVDADSGLVALRDNAIGHQQADYNIVNAAHIVKFSSLPGVPVSAEVRDSLLSKVAAVPEETLQKYYARESEQVGCFVYTRFFTVSAPYVSPTRSGGHPSKLQRLLGKEFRRMRNGFSTRFTKLSHVAGLSTQL
jgi:hypothetical protein